MAFLIFRYTLRPLATAFIIVAKLSSESIIDAASLDTSVPVMPIATPMSAFFSAGASLTPSPVMDTILPFLCQASTIRILFSGDTLAYTDILLTLSSSSLDSGLGGSTIDTIPRKINPYSVSGLNTSSDSLYAKASTLSPF